MGRQPCCDKVGLKKGPWTAEEDKKLINFLLINGQCCWRAVPKLAGLLRCGKSCRLRWTNYLRPDLKRGLLSEYEEKMVIDLHAQLGNRWSKIASHLLGRTDNEIKNHWNTHIKKKLKKMGIDPVTHKPLSNIAIDQNQNQSPKQQEEQDEEHKNQPSLEVDFDPNSEHEIIHQNNKETEHKKPESSNSIGSSSSSLSSSSTTTITESKLEEEDKIIIMTTPLFDTMEIMNNGFCTDEVPIIEPDEILVPCIPSSSSPSSSSSSSSYSSSHSNSNNLFLEELQLPEFEWSCNYINDDHSTIINNIDDDDNNNMSVALWDHDDDEFMKSLNFLINDDDDAPLCHPNTRMVMDSESWAYGLF